MPKFPATCQFCRDKFVANTLCNCCDFCWKLYKKFKGNKKKVKKYLKEQGII